MSLITKKISELTNISSPSSASLLLVQDGDTTYNFQFEKLTKTNNLGKILAGNNSGNMLYIEGKAGAGTTREGNTQRLLIKETGLAAYDATANDYAWSLNVPVSITQGGTGATSAAEARKALAVPYAPQSVGMQFSRSTSSGQHYFISGIAGTNSSYANKRILLFSTDTGFSCYNSTDGASIWNFKAAGLQAAVKDSVRFVHLSVANQSIAASSYATPSMTYTIPTGFEFGFILDVWCDTTGTSSAAGAGNVWCTNHWSSQSGTSTTHYAVMQNKGTSAAKVTTHIIIGITRTSY